MNRHRMSQGKRYFLVLAVALGLGVAAPPAGADGAAGWETLRRDDGIVVQRKDVPGSPFVAFRGEGDINAPLLLVGSVLVDVSRSREWVDSVVESRVLRRLSETEYVTYSHIGTPWPLSDREFVTDVVLEVDAATKKLTIKLRSVGDPAAPRTGYVRGQLTDSSWVLTSIDGGARTHVAAEIHADPKGDVPAWIVNMFQKNWGYNTLMSLRKQVAKRDIAVHPRLKAVLEEKGFFPAPPAPPPAADPPPAPAPAASAP
jgi:hypothetical protein